MTDPTRRAYDRIAATFDAVNSALPAGLAGVAARFLAHLPEAPRILDVGCGPGRDMALFESLGARATGADFSGEMLAVARTRVRGDLVQADMRKLPFGASSFDGLWCNAAILHLPKPEAPVALTEFRRVLTANGCAFLSIQTGTSEGLEASDVYGEGVERFFARYEPEAFLALLETNGFAVRWHETVQASHGRTWLRVLAAPTR